MDKNCVGEEKIFSFCSSKYSLGALTQERIQEKSVQIYVSFMWHRSLPKKMKTLRTGINPSIFMLGLLKNGKSWENVVGRKRCELSVVS